MARSWLSDLRCVIFAAGEYPSPCFSFNSRASAWDWIWVCLCLLQKALSFFLGNMQNGTLFIRRPPSGLPSLFLGSLPLPLLPAFPNGYPLPGAQIWAGERVKERADPRVLAGVCFCCFLNRALSQPFVHSFFHIVHCPVRYLLLCFLNGIKDVGDFIRDGIRVDDGVL